MTVKKCIENRRSFRSFKGDMLPKELIEDILNSGRLAPSAKNKQPWRFVVVSGETKYNIADMMIEYSIKHDMLIKREGSGLVCSVNPTAKIIKQAPILIIVLREKDTDWVVGDNLSIGACVENMCLRATELGIGSLWVRDCVYVADEIASLLNHPELECNCALVLGYANETPKQRPRKPLDDIVEWYI